MPTPTAPEVTSTVEKPRSCRAAMPAVRWASRVSSSPPSLQSTRVPTLTTRVRTSWNRVSRVWAAAEAEAEDEDEEGDIGAKSAKSCARTEWEYGTRHPKINRRNRDRRQQTRIRKSPGRDTL